MRRFLCRNKICSIDRILDLSEYWKKRGTDYYNELQNQPNHLQSRLKEQEKHLIELLKNQNFKSILEIGCGWGRFTKILFEFFKPENYLAIDISESQIENAKKYVKNGNIEFRCVTIQDLDVRDKFELVFGGEVLMHIPFTDINEVIAKLVSLSKNKIISIDWYDENKIGVQSGGYCFVHDYPQLFKKYGVKKIIKNDTPFSTRLRILDAYVKLRGRHGIEKQSIFDITI